MMKLPGAALLVATLTASPAAAQTRALVGATVIDGTGAPALPTRPS